MSIDALFNNEYGRQKSCSLITPLSYGRLGVFPAAWSSTIA
jgi:hypothetical protein